MPSTTRSPLRSLLRSFALSLAAWMVIGLFFFSQDAARIILWQQRTALSDEFLARMTGACISALFTPLVLWAGSRFRIERNNWLPMVALHMAFAVAFALLQVAAEAAVYLKMSILTNFLQKSFAGALVQMLAAGFHDSVVVYWLLIGVQTGVRYYTRYREQEKTTLSLRLSALKAQLQPHFLFNTLNAITVLVRQNRIEAADETLTRLGDLLRAVLHDSEAQEVPLRRELECLKLYLGIENVRFGERLEAVFEVEGETLDAAVPHMSLQPLVENAVRHGVSRRAAPGWINFSARRDDQHLEVRIADNGPGPANHSAQDGKGFGLKNTRARLRQLYGGAATLKIEAGKPSGTVVTVRIPFRPLKETAPQRIELK